MPSGLCETLHALHSSTALIKNNGDAAGPVDGPAIFDNVKGCHISVAAQQLQVRGSADSEFAVYSANKPTIEHSTGLSWMS